METIGFLKKTNVSLHPPYACNHFNAKYVVQCFVRFLLLLQKSFAPQYQKLSFSISRSIRGCHIMSKTDRSESGQDLRKVCIPNKKTIRNTKIPSTWICKNISRRWHENIMRWIVDTKSDILSASRLLIHDLSRKIRRCSDDEECAPL